MLLLSWALACSNISHAKEPSEFDGIWRQRSKAPKELVIQLDGNVLRLTLTGPGKIHSVNLNFQIGGPAVTYTGLDGDEFHVKVMRDGNSLVFDGSEHEEGSQLRVHEVWTVRNQGGGQVLVATKNAKRPGAPAKLTEYERVEQPALTRQHIAP